MESTKSHNFELREIGEIKPYERNPRVDDSAAGSARDGHGFLSGASDTTPA